MFIHFRLVHTPAQLTLPFGSHGVTHPAQERRSPCLAASVEERKALTNLGAVAQALDVAELDRRRLHRLGEAERVVSRERSGSDPGILVSHVPGNVHKRH